MIDSLIMSILGFMRIACGVEYCGSDFYGWQTQFDTPETVQAYLEAALSQVANEPIVIQGAGRTDKGVHATGQVFHFDTTANRPMHGWMMGVNTHLPDSIKLTWAQAVGEDFDARRTATSRRYRYFIEERVGRNAFAHHLLTRSYETLNVEAMHSAAQHLIGEHDFSSFRATQCQAKHPNRCIEYIKVKRVGTLVMIDIQANAFLHHMVRNITGCLMAVGRGEFPTSWTKEVLEARNRSAADVTAPPNGLYLVDVIYPNSYKLPRLPIGPWFIAKL